MSDYLSFVQIFEKNNLKPYQEKSVKSLPIPISTSRSSIKSISIANGLLCLIFDNNQIKCLGNNEYGQLGQGHTRSLGGNVKDRIETISNIDLGNEMNASGVVTSPNTICILISSKEFNGNNKIK